MSKLFRCLLLLTLGGVLQSPLNALVPPVILQEPQAVVAFEGDAAEFTVNAMGLSLRYQWYKNNSAINGATRSSFRIEKVSQQDAGLYHVLIFSALGSGSSRKAQLSLYQSVTITSQPASQSVAPGANVVLNVQAAGSPGPFYQWTLNGEIIPDANAPSLALANINPVDGGNYQVLVFNGVEVVTSQPAIVSVDLPALPFVDAIAARGEITGASGLGRGDNTAATHEINQPYGGGIDARKSVWLKWVAPASGYVTFSTAGSSFDTLLAGFLVSNGNFELLAHDDDASDYHTSLAQFNVTAGNEYAIMVDGEDGSSGNIVLGWTFRAGRKMPVITSQPLSQTLNLGQLLSLNLILDFDGDYTVQWFRNGEPIPNLLGPILNLASVLGLPVGVYYARITTDENEVFYTDDAEIQINTEGLKAASRNKRAHATTMGIRTTGALSGLSSGRIKAFSISGSAGYSGTQIFQTMPGRDYDEPNHCGVVGGASYWLAYTAPSSGTLNLTTDGSSFDTLLAVYVNSGGGSGYASLSRVTCDNNSGADGRDSRVGLNVNAGQTYYIVVDGVYGAYGTAYLKYALNDVPVITAPSSFSIQEDSSSGARSFTVSDRETPAGSLTVYAYTSNAGLIPAGYISLGGSGSQRTISVRPAANATGTATITLVVYDSNGAASSSYFNVTVSPVNDAPYAYSDSVSRSGRFSSLSIYIPNLIANDRDADLDTISFYGFGNPSNGGKLSRNGDYLLYTPPSNYISSDYFTYGIVDGKGGYASAQVTVVTQ